MPVRLPSGEVVGHIRANESLQNLFCKCLKHRDEDCTKTRTYRIGRERGSGAPLGFLAAWCAAQGGHGSKASHMQERPSYELRRAARSRLARDPLYAHFHAFEALQAPPGETEPEEVPRR